MSASPLSSDDRASSLKSFLARQTTKMSSSGVNSFCGAMAGMASGMVTCPLDVIKTKLQGQASFTSSSYSSSCANPANEPPTRTIYRGMVGTAKTIVQQDGLRGMYRGLGPMLLGYLPTWAVYMGVYDGSRDFYYARVDNKWLARVYASVTAGACSTLVTNPIWVIKTRLMSQSSLPNSAGGRTPWHYNNTLDAARKMWASEGVGSFYSGLTPALLGLTHVAIQFPLYEYFKMRFTGLEMGEATSQTSSGTTLGILASTFLSKVCATSATYPHEVLRTRLQTQQRVYATPSSMDVHTGPADVSNMARTGGSFSKGPRYRGVIRTFNVILQEEGWRAFYNGMGTNMFRAVPAAMTTMLTYETLKAAIIRLQDKDQANVQQE